MNKREIVLAFVIGSSILSTIFTLSYVGNAFKLAGRPPSISYEMIAIVVPILFGLFNILNVYLTRVYKNANVALIVGMLQGVVFSSLGRFGMQMPSKLFGMKAGEANAAHVYAILIYMFLHRFVLVTLNQYLL